MITRLQRPVCGRAFDSALTGTYESDLRGSLLPFAGHPLSAAVATGRRRWLAHVDAHQKGAPIEWAGGSRRRRSRSHRTCRSHRGSDRNCGRRRHRGSVRNRGRWGRCGCDRRRVSRRRRPRGYGRQTGRGGGVTVTVGVGVRDGPGVGVGAAVWKLSRAHSASTCTVFDPVQATFKSRQPHIVPFRTKRIWNVDHTGVC